MFYCFTLILYYEHTNVPMRHVNQKKCDNSIKTNKNNIQIRKYENKFSLCFPFQLVFVFGVFCVIEISHIIIQEFQCAPVILFTYCCILYYIRLSFYPTCTAHKI